MSPITHNQYHELAKIVYLLACAEKKTHTYEEIQRFFEACSDHSDEQLEIPVANTAHQLRCLFFE